MLRKILKSTLVAVVALGLSFSFVQGSFAAEEQITGKCSITIDANKHTGEGNNRAKATGQCGKLVTGWYGAGNYIVMGGHDSTVVDGEKYNVTIMPGFYTYEVTVHTIAPIQTVKVPLVASINTSDIKVNGSTTAGAKVIIKNSSKTLGTAIANINGLYSVKIFKQKVGAKLNVTATKGKVSKTKTVTVQYPSPKVTTVKASSPSVKGTTIAGAKVIVKNGFKTLGSATANKKGVFAVRIKKQKAGAKLTITAVKGKNTSETKTVTVQK